MAAPLMEIVVCWSNEKAGHMLVVLSSIIIHISTATEAFVDI